jgi:hypothetical protein
MCYKKSIGLNHVLAKGGGFGEVDLFEDDEHVLLERESCKGCEFMGETLEVLQFREADFDAYLLSMWVEFEDVDHG